MFKIFEYFRNIGVDLKKGDVVKLYSPEYLIGLGFCQHSNKNGTDPFALIDGKENNGWANRVMIGEQSFFIIDFLQISVFVKKVFVQTDCQAPKDLTVKGSNDNLTWHTLISFPNLNDNSNHYLSSNVRKSFRFIQFKSIESTRLVLSSIEIFGSLGNSCVFTFKQCSRNKLMFVFFIFALFK